jgi:hypothetical protein
MADDSSKPVSPEKSGMRISTRMLLGIILFIVIILTVAILTLNVMVLDTQPAAAYPFTTMYAVAFPEGKPQTIGNIHIVVLAYNNEIVSDIDGSREKLTVGENRILSERRAIITTLGVITVIDTNFRITLKYKGERDNQAYFDMALQTSKQVPDILIRKVLPAEMNAQPM